MYFRKFLIIFSISLLTIVLFAEPSLTDSDTRFVTPDDLVAKVLKRVPRNPSNVGKEPYTSRRVSEGFQIIIDNDLGKRPPIRNLLLHWSTQTDFSDQEGLMPLFSTFQKATLTLTDRYLLELYIKNLPHKLSVVESKLKTDEEFVRRFTEEIILTLEETTREKRNDGKSKLESKPKTAVGEKSGSRIHHIIFGLAHYSTRLDTEGKEIVNTILNTNFDTPKDLLLLGPKPGNAYNWLAFTKLAEEIKWDAAAPLLKDIDNGKLDDEINRLKFGSDIRLLIKQFAGRALQEIQ